ncbi:MAG: hypothetical protein A3D52_02650 [Candidatus Taylorbacteria bacterium RIFCSPHIGHO2_02_FULL_44_36]|uniref:Uncharacterized protein n=1 Tax=Candidatus Taylorbacteria bacterium RIFCSPLOWO2_12_FULL_44_15c TaxID=1802333 RepID=A0A1G2P6R0_9BACT|nr:MAG: hypothetical protein A3D52_02650 [Candidatus Taylorbacteria bacterium RIFCSPHIGHO2_02_FULL_44_36]OHA38025.1 MAG: hypothetical protein A3I97_02945 [Candidatus Taylorbacteria bacterium RIFCSPLOWO2_02_FULL_44_35]OHA43409.1 MAG: hypothetical protein A3G03_01165 [Candidatus Taylorbacteria bacterium RIFCSPLOWO2_12_FULL_44_15c]
MTTLTVSKKEFKSVIRESIREALVSELAQIRAAFLPFVSDKEQKEIERQYGKPTRKTAKSYIARI